MAIEMDRLRSPQLGGTEAFKTDSRELRLGSGMLRGSCGMMSMISKMPNVNMSQSTRNTCSGLIVQAQSGKKWMGITTMTIPTPIHPIPTCLHPSRVIRITSEHPMPNPNPLASIPSQLASNASLNPLTPSHLSNALPNTPTPLRLADAFPTQCTFDLSSSSRQVDS